MSDLSKAICDAGERAVKEYRKITGLNDEAAIPEIFLTALMAKHLHHALKMHARVEQRYSELAKDIASLGGPRRPQQKFTGKKADIALYKNSRLSAIIEVKAARDGTDLETLRQDLEKVKDLSHRDIPAYGAYFICQTAPTGLSEQIQKIERLVGKLTSITLPIKSATGKSWSWCIGCVRA